jgi:maleamate amidohydrolase
LSEQEHVVEISSGRYDELGDPALVIVDCQRLFTSGPQTAPATEQALENIGALASECRARGVPVIHARTVFASPDELGVGWATKVPAMIALAPGSDAAAFDPRVAPRAGELVIEKRRASAFFGTELGTELEDRGIRTIVVVGLTTSGCVRATAVDAASNDFKAVVLDDCVADRTTSSHEVSLSDLDSRYADVMSTAEWLTTLGAPADAEPAGP